MYTGTMIGELLGMVERIEREARRRQMEEERELQALIASQRSLLQDEAVYLGAA